MKCDAYRVMEAEFRSAGDERLWRDWEAAKRADADNPEGWARLDFVDNVNQGYYWEERKRARREAARLEAGVKRRTRAVELGAGTAYPVGRQVAAERDAGRLSFEEACLLADALGVPLDRFRTA